MTDYISLPVEADPAALAGYAFDYLESAVPGWSPAPANIDTLVIEAVAQIAAETAEVASGVPASIFRYFGPIVGVPPLEASPATGTATLMFRDASVYTVEAGAVVGLRDDLGALWTFETTADATGAGSAVVTIEAQTPGVDANGLSGALELVEVPTFVVSGALTGATAAGTDAEEDDVYLDRLAETLALLSPRPILPNDFAVLARSIPGVFRAAAIDGLKPGPPYDVAAEAFGQPRTITVAVASVTGSTVGAPIRAAVAALLQSEREANFLVYVVDPIYATIDVTAIVKCWPGYDPADVDARATAAVQAWLASATWGSGPDGDATTWLDERTVRLGELYEVLNSVEGVRYVSGTPTLGINGSAGQVAANITIGGVSSIPVLTTPGSIDITAVA